MPVIHVETHIAAPPERCFDLARDVAAHIASTAGSGERAVAGVTVGMLGPGDEVTWAARHFGVPWRLTSRITEFDRPRRFVDEQVRGPFRSWWHEHRFETVAGGTSMVDRVRYRAPLGPLGRLAERLFLHRYMTALLERRAESLRRMAEGGIDPGVG